MEEKCLRFSVSNNSVTHLGRNLYSTTPPALAELIANSYDAYATVVDIEMNEEQVIIADNGKGMTVDGIRSKYALIGRQKLLESPFLKLAERKPMGKKGIGKLASFSIGEKYTVYTKTLDGEKWITFCLEYKKMIDKFDEDYTVNYQEIEDLPEELSKYRDYEHGFIIVIEQLIRKAIKSTGTGIENQVSRRFYLSDDFEVNMDGEPISLIANEYYTNLNFVVYFGYSETEMKKQFKDYVELFEYQDNESVVNFIKEKK
ncbi:ATP-binding protein [Erysipelothrix anatis]|uniref:ATP-binding protein n=1 Tax=Erysipelothrix anatis TaxID=2683713 RepID=UPI00135AD867|nr:ATP-binding protein [Erysipelothrix anatis]